MTIDDIGRRCVARDLAGVTIAAFNAEKQAKQEREQRRIEKAAARRQVMARQHQQVLERVKAAQARQQIGADSGDLAASALATVLAGGDDHERKMAVAGRRMDAWLRGESYGGIIRGLKEE